MKDFPNENASTRKKVILSFVIVNFLIIAGFAVLELVAGLTIEYVPGIHTLNLKPLLYFFACICAILAFIELIFGILTYKGKKWAAIALISCEIISWVGIFGAAAAIIELAKPRTVVMQS